MTHANEDKLKIEFDKLLQDGYTEGCDSTWSRLWFGLQKKSSTGLCVDFRVNSLHRE